MVILAVLPSLGRAIGRTLQAILCDQSGTQEGVLKLGMYTDWAS